jgi:hypothetical protein
LFLESFEFVICNLNFVIAAIYIFYKSNPPSLSRGLAFICKNDQAAVQELHAGHDQVFTEVQLRLGVGPYHVSVNLSDVHPRP